MKNFNKSILSTALNSTFCVAVLLCSGYSKAAVTDSAKLRTADSTEETFPELKKSYLEIGDFVQPELVKRIRTGLNKDQVRLQLGNPHYSEGIFGVKMWDYTFNFYTGIGNEYVTCQYKVKFDKDYLVKSTYWKDNQCENYLNPPPVHVPPAPIASLPLVLGPVDTVPVAILASAKQLISIQSDALFQFGKSNIESIMSPEREKLADLISNLKQTSTDLTVITIEGHTDYIGSSASNHALSLARANAVRSYLVLQGLQSKHIRTYGAGETNPIKECESKRVTPALIECLQPNRRVEIEIAQMK